MKKKIIVILVALVILIVGLSAWYVIAKNIKHKAVNTQSSTQETADVIKTDNVNDCSKLAGKNEFGQDAVTVCKNNIYWNEAQKNLDYSACNKLDDKYIKIVDCQRQILEANMAKSLTLDVCKSAPAAVLNTYCVTVYWSKQALSMNNAQLCNSISDSQDKSICSDSVFAYALFKQPAGFDCKKFSDASDQSLCAQVIASNKNGAISCFVYSTNLLFNSACLEAYKVE